MARYTCPHIISMLERIIQCPLHYVPTYKTTDLAVQIYKNKGDGTNWHHDWSFSMDADHLHF